MWGIYYICHFFITWLFLLICISVFDRNITLFLIMDIIIFLKLCLLLNSILLFGIFLFEILLFCKCIMRRRIFDILRFFIRNHPNFRLKIHMSLNLILLFDLFLLLLLFLSKRIHILNSHLLFLFLLISIFINRCDLAFCKYLAIWRRLVLILLLG